MVPALCDGLVIVPFPTTWKGEHSTSFSVEAKVQRFSWEAANRGLSCFLEIFFHELGEAARWRKKGSIGKDFCVQVDTLWNYIERENINKCHLPAAMCKSASARLLLFGDMKPGVCTLTLFLTNVKFKRQTIQIVAQSWKEFVKTTSTKTHTKKITIINTQTTTNWQKSVECPELKRVSM